MFLQLLDNLCRKQVYNSAFQVITAFQLITLHRDSHFTCVIDSVILESILRKGRDKRCRKTSTLIRAIFVTLIHLNALPSFVLCRTPHCPEAQTIAVPDPVFQWTRRMRGSPETKVTQALVDTNIVPPL